MTAQQPLVYDAFVELAAADSAVVGLVLKGSRAHDGMVTPHSDHDLYVILADDARTDLTRFAGHRTPELDLVIVSLTEFRAAGMPGFERYALARAQVVLDRLDGGIARILADKARLGADEAFKVSSDWLDAYANSLYRSVKNHRDGQALAARLDAAESVRCLLEMLFALDHRPRPYNKYLEWELARQPLPRPAAAPLHPCRGDSPRGRARRSAGRMGGRPQSHATSVRGTEICSYGRGTCRPSQHASGLLFRILSDARGSPVLLGTGEG